MKRTARVAWGVALLALGAALAQATPYAATEPGAAVSYLELAWHGDGTVAGRLLGDPGRHGAFAYAFEGEAATADGALRATVAAEPVPAGDEARTLTLTVDTMARGTALDPFGEARVTFAEAPANAPSATVAFAAIGTALDAAVTLADGSLEVTRVAPLFHAEPWRALDFAGEAVGPLATNLRQGLARRRERGDAVAGLWFDHRRTTVRALTPELVSVLHVQETFTGGAHPNTVLGSETLLAGRDGWRPAAPCEAARALRWPCDEAVLRDRVIAALREREAAWVESGEVTAAAPWLLDAFTVEPGGLAVHFSPYAVGPYAQGPFEVRVPFESLRE